MTNPLSVISNAVPSSFAAPSSCRAEEVPGGVGDQTGKRIRPVCAVEADQRVRRVGAAAVVDELEHRAIAGRPAELVVPKRSPAASAIRPPYGFAPLAPLKLSSVTGV